MHAGLVDAVRRFIVGVDERTAALDYCSAKRLLSFINIPGSIEIEAEFQLSLLHERPNLINVMIADVEGRQTSLLHLLLQRQSKWLVVFPGPGDGQVVAQGG